jgi:hypothetical protein
MQVFMHYLRIIGFLYLLKKLPITAAMNNDCLLSDLDIMPKEVPSGFYLFHDTAKLFIFRTF